ncbi:glycosyltransferase family 4 protein [Chitinibacter sp. SCUT-21]|uniref:glycosyltransferase family 4 protein n=1 Tax=Chitinibacter sp. SCUT-21 TaxID=2970891 RepID=UPI0035A71385
MLSTRPRILHMTRNLPPLVGGMERLNWHIADELANYADVHVMGPDGSYNSKPKQVQLSEISLRPLWKFLLLAKIYGVFLAKKFKPDIVLAGSGLMAPAALFAARITGARACVYVHGLDVAVMHPIYRALWHPAIRHMDAVIANSLPTAELAQEIGVNPKKINIVHPGVDIPKSRQAMAALQAFRLQHGLGNARILLSIGRLTTRKGLREFVLEALPAIVKVEPHTLLVVIGDAPSDALRAGAQSRESIQAAAATVGVSQNLRFLGVVTDPIELALAYESAELHVFPVRTLPGDPEGFGMVAIEAAAHGLPTVAFASGGVIEAVANERSGVLVPPGDYPAFAQAVLNVLAADKAVFSRSASDFAKEFAWPEFGSKLFPLLQNQI